jgi:F-type H+-transporting ATPase subunit delta
MIEGKLSRRYALALFQLARGAGNDEEIGREVEQFAAAYAVPPLPTVLNNPAFTVQSRKKVVVQLAEHLKFSPSVIHFLSLLLDHDRIGYLPSVNFYYRRLQDDARGRVQAKVTATSALGADELGKLCSALKSISSREVVLEEETDSGLLGGLVVKMEGKVYDGSIRTQLEKMRKQIEQGY